METKDLVLISDESNVSVPLRGLIMWKLPQDEQFIGLKGFSPLTGINYVETNYAVYSTFSKKFQSPYGD